MDDQKPIDIDVARSHATAALALDAKRTPGEWATERDNEGLEMGGGADWPYEVRVGGTVVLNYMGGHMVTDEDDAFITGATSPDHGMAALACDNLELVAEVAKLRDDEQEARDFRVDALEAEVAKLRAERDAAVAWCKQKADAAQREAEAHEMQLSDARTYDEASAKRERRERCEGQAVAFRATAEKLAGDANTKSEEPTR